ncbi:MAG: retroviral-like aspartic protease [Candidatus Eremiobacteraeota bacterium]|nr:retroviral-like aspartic protease [Candidatus Eremiobacteraeota bacterium]MBV9055115.1 retroviral-like aspartic protease [Candidatus Eremiobacteraeota bacterium]MBV9698896.1 retroviral-like aspartic protease [Candidatus Eremiobacteraeota bacterium]
MPFAARTALLCALLAATLGAAHSDGSAGLLRRMRDAAGPVWSAHIVSVARLVLDGTPTVVSAETQGPRVLVKHCAGEVCDGTYFNGERLYSLNMNSTLVPQPRQSEPFLRSVRIAGGLLFLGPSSEAPGVRVVNGGTAWYDSKPYRTLTIEGSDLIPLRLYVDPRRWLLRVVRTLDGRETFEYVGYRRIGAFSLPFEVLHNGRILERYDDRAIVASVLQPPRGLVPAFNGPAESVATDPRSVTPIVECSVGGVPTRCLIDSGNSGLSMSSELASRLGATVVGSYKVRGLGDYSTQVVRAGPLRIANATYPEAYYVVLTDLRRYGYDVVLGADMLATANIEIDPVAHAVRLGVSDAHEGVAIPLSFENFIPVVTVDLGSVEAQLAVDTGDESNINLSYDFYEKHPGLFTVTQRRTVGGIGGNSIEMIGEIGDVRIGDYRLGPQRIGTTQTLQGTAFGHLGAGFLSQFLVRLDYAGGELRLLPRRT